jgi:hypothetical protein
MSSLLLYRRRSRSSTRNYVERETSGPWSSSLSSSKQWQDQQAHWRCKSQTGSGSETWSKLAEWTHEVTALLQQCTGVTQHHAHPTATVQRPSIQLRPHTRSTTGGVQVAVVTWHYSLVCSVTKEVNGRETEWAQHNTTQHNTTGVRIVSPKFRPELDWRGTPQLVNVTPTLRHFISNKG